MSNHIDHFSELLANPLGDLISSVGRGVGEAQAALDAGSLEQTLDIYREDINRSDDANQTVKLLREIGYQPTFYVIPETEVEAQVSISMTLSGQQQQSTIQNTFHARYKMLATPVNAGNVNKYNLHSQAVAKIKFKIVPVPPSAGVSEMRIVPDLAGMTYDAAKNLLESLRLSYELSEDSPKKGTISSFQPDQGTIVSVGDVIQLKLEDPSVK